MVSRCNSKDGRAGSQLVSSQLAERSPERRRILEAHAAYLSTFLLASLNDWSVPRSSNVPRFSEEIRRYVPPFKALETHISLPARSLCRSIVKLERTHDLH